MGENSSQPNKLIPGELYSLRNSNWFHAKSFESGIIDGLCRTTIARIFKRISKEEARQEHLAWGLLDHRQHYKFWVYKTTLPPLSSLPRKDSLQESARGEQADNEVYYRCARPPVAKSFRRPATAPSNFKDISIEWALLSIALDAEALNQFISALQQEDAFIRSMIDKYQIAIEESFKNRDFLMYCGEVSPYVEDGQQDTDSLFFHSKSQEFLILGKSILVHESGQETETNRHPGKQFRYELEK